MTPAQSPATPGHADSDTPAPWVVESDDYRVCVHDACGGLVAECTDGFDGDDGWVMAAKSEHVAHLIAVAPELFAELQWIANNDGECIGDHPKRLARIRAAIARAQGAKHG